MNKLLAQGVDIGQAFQLGGEGIGTKSGYESVGSFLSGILPNVYIIAGLILFFLILMGGYGLLAAGDDPEKLKQSSKTFTAAIGGFLIIFVSYWIIQIIEVLTGIAIFDPGV